MPTSKRQQVTEYVKSLPSGERATGMNLHDMVLGLEVSPSTVYRALHELKADGSVDGQFRRVRREFSRELSAEVVAYVRSQDGFVLLTPKRERELCEHFNCTPLALQLAFEWAVEGKQLQRGESVYGDIYTLPGESLYSNQV